MRWLKGEGGYSKSGIAADEVIGMVPVTKLVSPSGKHVIHYGGDQNEELSPLMIDYYDRRLVMASPFRSLPLGGN
jgi:hypothetical protein